MKSNGSTVSVFCTLVCLLIALSLAAGCGSKAREPGVDEVEKPAPSEPAEELEDEADAEEEEGEGAPDEGGDEEAVAEAPAEETDPGSVVTPDVHFVPTPMPVVKKMLEVAKVTKNDLVYDLGCGDGRIVIMAAEKHGARAVGFDIDPERVAEARANVEKAGVGHLVTIKQANIFELDLTPASVITLYLLPSLNVKLIPQLEKMKKGTRIVSHDFDMDGIAHEQFHVVTANEDDDEPSRDHHVYFWTIPLQPDGE